MTADVEGSLGVGRVLRCAGRVSRAGGVCAPALLVIRLPASDDHEWVNTVPTGKVKWYDSAKGFGFLSQDEGEDVYVRSGALPEGLETLKAGQRVEFDMATGRRGPQALRVKVLEPAPSVRRGRQARGEGAHRRSTDELHGMVEDMITLLEATVQPELRKGRHPDHKTAQRISEVVRAVARELES